MGWCCPFPLCFDATSRAAQTPAGTSAYLMFRPKGDGSSYGLNVIKVIILDRRQLNLSAKRLNDAFRNEKKTLSTKTRAAINSLALLCMTALQTLRNVRGCHLRQMLCQAFQSLFAALNGAELLDHKVAIGL